MGSIFEGEVERHKRYIEEQAEAKADGAAIKDWAEGHARIKASVEEQSEKYRRHLNAPARIEAAQATVRDREARRQMFAAGRRKVTS